MDDVVIVGGGIIGASIAYFLSKEGRKVKVFERDPTYKSASFPLSLGGFRRQFFQKENILLGKFAKEFIFQLPDLLETKKNGKPTVSVVPNGYLLLFNKEQADTIVSASISLRFLISFFSNIAPNSIALFFNAV